MAKYKEVESELEGKKGAEPRRVSNGDASHFEVELAEASSATGPSTSAGSPSCRRLLQDVVDAPRNVVSFYRRLSRRFSWQFVAMVSVVYGINQGLGEGWYFFATEWYLSSKVPQGLGLPADRMQSVLSFANIPWQVKSIYGIISDTFSINGYRRTPYLIIAGALGVVAWTWLALDPSYSVWITAILLVLGNLSVASPDVMIDASVAERCKEDPKFTTDLQSLCWISLGIGQIVSSLSSGVLYEAIGAKGLFAITSLTALAMLLPAGMGWLKEEPTSSLPDAELNENVNGRIASNKSGCESLREALRDPVRAPVYKLSVIVLLISLSMGGVANSFNDNAITLVAAIVCSCLISFMVYQFEKGISMRLAKASVYLYLSAAIAPSSKLIFYWSKESEENCSGKYGNRPCFSPVFLSILDVIGYIFFVVGTACYNKYFSNWSYRGIWSFTQVLMASVGMLDFIFVMRWNLAVGIPDTVFMIGDEIVTELVFRFNTMPLFVLAASMCPDGVEATLFAMNMGLSNFGGTVSRYMGNGLMWVLDVQGPEYNRLPLFVVVRSLMKLLPLLFIPLLVPEGSPSTEEEFTKKSSANNDADVETLNAEDSTPLMRS